MDNSTAPLTSIGHRWHRPAFAFLFMSNPASAPRGRHTARTAGTRDHYTMWLWDTRATCICDTLTWFPTKTTMPLASSNDLIIAGIKDIVHALNNPSPGLPPAPLTDSHHNALTDLTNLLTSIVNPDTKPSPAASGSLLQRHDPPLRVTESPSDVTCLPVGHLTHPSTLPLRVFPPPAAANPKTVSFAPLPVQLFQTVPMHKANNADAFGGKTTHPPQPTQRKQCIRTSSWSPSPTVSWRPIITAHDPLQNDSNM